MSRQQDAFEVALLESITMTPLAGVTTGLTQTDALFNLQQDGTVRFSNQVALSNGTLSGSTFDLTEPVIVDIDLIGITVGTRGRLSFDLIGFGDRTSTIVLDNVLLRDGQPTAALVAVNDSYTVAEGATFRLPTFGLLDNDSDIDTPKMDLAAALVSGPTNGTLSLRADETFSYIHNGSKTATDSFAYHASDGINFSNVATVSITITPTNDVPKITAVAPQTVEQGRTLTFTAVATDPDDSNLTLELNHLVWSLGQNAHNGSIIYLTTSGFTWVVPRTHPILQYTITVTGLGVDTMNPPDSRTFITRKQPDGPVDLLDMSNKNWIATGLEASQDGMTCCWTCPTACLDYSVVRGRDELEWQRSVN